MLFDWHISIYDWAIWDSPAEAPQYLQKKKSVCYQTNIYLNIRYFYLGSILQLSFLYSVLIVNSWMCYLPDKYHHCWFNTLIQVYQIVIVFCSLFINFKYWWISELRTLEMPTEGQFWGGQFWVCHSSELPTLDYFDYINFKYSLVAAECHYEFDCSIIVSFTWNCSIRTWMAWISCGIWRKIELKYSLKEKKISLEGKCWH